MEAKTYVLKSGKTVAGVTESVENYFITHGPDSKIQTLQADDGSTIIQMEETFFVTKMTGMNTALTVRIIPVGETNVTIEIGHAKWLKKTAFAAVATALMGPFFIATYAIGVAGQLLSPKRVFTAIDAYLNDSPDEKTE